ncbi:hypothetical protein [Tardiphaga sp. P9-11]|uniref:hypothetical protein n=1 Tax=Tardiphaga sp. P9-11 TaxID=2024614 RepID=UPI0011F1C46F|nr:hypothetical protein [Tardiphaga sp. P9-11]KAA0070449.1 hypothetical protein CIW50_26725 [Tardiphaga sp. P9-11]
MKTPDEQRRESEFLQFFGRHLVALCVTFRESDKPNEAPSFRAYAGTLISIEGAIFFLTAGHILSELHDALKSNEVEILNAVLSDNFGAGRISNLPIPFDLKNAPMFFIDDDEEGLDFGVVALRPYYVRLLAANGLVALEEKNWSHQHTIEFDAHLMLGLPVEYTSDRVDAAGEGRVSATMLAVKQLKTLPDGVVATRHPRFVGQISGNLSLSSVKGMSGGPIFGFNFDPPMRYWVVALQSTWLRDRRLVFACPVPVLASMMTTWA